MSKAIRSILLLVALVVVPALGLYACGGDDNPAADGDIQPECESAADCPVGEVCNTYTQQCQSPDIPICPPERECTEDQQCVDAGYTGYTCTQGCCLFGGFDCLTQGCGVHYTCNETTGECEPGEDHCSNAGCTDPFVCNDNTGVCDPGDDHCSNAGCDQYFACDDATGLCEPGSDHCSNTPCDTLFTCNDTTGACDPGADHCNTTGCEDLTVCNMETGLCDAGADHCSNTGCEDRYTCNTETGLCVPGDDHCAVTPCGSHYTCNQQTGLCEAAPDHCQFTDCLERYRCDMNSGDCVPGSDHCANRACYFDYDCNEVTGLCEPNEDQVAACSGACSDGYCIERGDYLCECNDGQYRVVDCLARCQSEGKPFLERCGSSDGGAEDCQCGNYDDLTDGNCSSPIPIDHFPYFHSWEMVGAGANLNAFGCEQIGSQGTSGDDASYYERVYSLEARANEKYYIKLKDKVYVSASYLTIRNSCGNTFTFCQHANGTNMLPGTDEFTVTIPADGTYFITVESTNALVFMYELTVEQR